MNYKYEPRIDFDPKPFIEAALQLVRSEDTNKAIQLLTELLPSYYRDNPPEEIQALVKSIRSAKWLTSDYSLNNKDNLKPIEHCTNAVEGLLRFKIIKEELLRVNKEGIIPHIVDLGPGDFTMPIGLNAAGCKFTYRPIGVYEHAKVEAKKLLNHLWMESEVRDGPSWFQKPVWFVAYEIIEHLENEFEIRQQMARLPTLPQRIFCSTPLYTFAQGNLTWRETQIAHIRAYTPDEFFSICRKLFPEYTLSYVPFEIQMIIGDLK